MSAVFKKFRRYLPGLSVLVGSFIIVAGWNWYHLSKHNYHRFISISILIWVGVCISYLLFKKMYLYLVQRWRRHEFWYRDFPPFIDKIFLLSSLWFLIFFSRSERLSLLYSSFIFLLIFWRFHSYLKHHPAPGYWLRVNKAFFILGYCLFIIHALVQYSAYHYYILDSNIRFFNIVLFRALAITFLWLALFVLASFSYWRIKNRYLRYVPFMVWGFLYAAFMIFWVVNIGILYFSGLYISPVALEHMRGAGRVAFNSVSIYLTVAGSISAALLIAVLRHVLHSHHNTPPRYWYFYNTAVGAVAIVALIGLASFKNTPEHAIAKSFYNYFLGQETTVTLAPNIFKKLEKFGLQYNPNQFYVNDRSTVYHPTSTLKLLPDRFKITKPNILIVFWESFSARLSDVYNPAFTNLTPGLDTFAADAHTTIFKKYYNASTPTITGTLSQLCSFLPPTGHEEIQNERKLQSHRLLCLPEILKQHAGFKYAAYVTAVDKEFAHKDGIFTSMGVDKIFGTSELATFIPGEALSWGYSDHQMFPAVTKFMETAPQPFLMMLATVDSHPPFNLAQDEVKYHDGSQPVLNSYHTTDDAFGKFWNEFKQSPLYANTMVIVVGDHAIFPGALTKDTNAWPGHDDTKSFKTYYDQNTFLMYIPDSVLPKVVDLYSSGIDELPTLLHIFDINIPNSFEGHSLFDVRNNFSNLLGMHELGFYINQLDSTGKRVVQYNVPSEINCDAGGSTEEPVIVTTTMDLTLCDYLQFYRWKRQMFEQGRFWKH